MTKLGFYPKLAARSIKNNRQFYLPYILTVIGTCAAMYILYALYFDQASASSAPAPRTGRPMCRASW